ncbi:MAG: hypothetical protein N2D54_00900, partial [Chloroflexota bacterium]
MHKPTRLIFLLILITIPITANAQTGNIVSINNLTTDGFPHVTVSVDVRDSQGFFVSGLTAENAAVVENGLEIPANGLIEHRNGAKIVVAINTSDSFAIRDEVGLTRYDTISASLVSWLGPVGTENIDLLSLVTPEGALVNDTTNVNQWLEQLQAYQPIMENMIAGVTVLNQAIEIVFEPTTQPGSGKAIFFITPALSTSLSAGLQSLTEMAVQSNARVYVLLVDSPAVFDSQEAIQLQSLAAQTGGQYFAYSGSEPLPDFDFWFESARRSYELTYFSKINVAGMQELGVKISSPVGDMTSNFLDFEVALSPPNPVFVSVPAQIVRAIPDELEVAVENLFPKQFPLEVLFDFPDTLSREIVRSVLYANNVIVAEINQPPFNQFTLNLTKFEASERILLRVEVTDEIGLSGTSLDIPV